MMNSNAPNTLLAEAGTIQAVAVGSHKLQLFDATSSFSSTDTTTPSDNNETDNIIIKSQQQQQHFNKKFATLQGFTDSDNAGEIHAVCASPDGKFIAFSGKNSNDICLLRRSTKKLLKGHTSTITAIVFTNDSSVLISASNDRSILFWNLNNNNSGGEMICGEPLRGHHSSPISSMSVSPNNKFLATGADEIILWDLEKRKGLGGPLRGVLFDARALQFSPDSKLLACGDSVGLVSIWDIEKRNQCGALRGHNDQINDLEFSSDGTVLVSASSDGSLRVWDVETRKSISDPLEHDDSAVTACSFVGVEGTSLITSCLDGKLRCWNLSSAISFSNRNNNNSNSPTSLGATTTSSSNILAKSFQSSFTGFEFQQMFEPLDLEIPIHSFTIAPAVDIVVDSSSGIHKSLNLVCGLENSSSVLVEVCSVASPISCPLVVSAPSYISDVSFSSSSTTATTTSENFSVLNVTVSTSIDDVDGEKKNSASASSSASRGGEKQVLQVKVPTEAAKFAAISFAKMKKEQEKQQQQNEQEEQQQKDLTAPHQNNNNTNTNKSAMNMPKTSSGSTESNTTTTTSTTNQSISSKEREINFLSPEDLQSTEKLLGGGGQQNNNNGVSAAVSAPAILHAGSFHRHNPNITRMNPLGLTVEQRIERLPQTFRFNVDDIEILREKKLLGSGGGGVVYQAKLKTLGWSQNKVAVKRFKDSDLIQRALDECFISLKLKHPNLVTTHGIAIEHTRFSTELLMILELAECSLNHILAKYVLDFDVCHAFARQMAHGIGFLHSRSSGVDGKVLIHRDIKPANILLFRPTQISNLSMTARRIHLPGFQQPSGAGGEQNPDYLSASHSEQTPMSPSFLSTTATTTAVSQHSPAVVTPTSTSPTTTTTKTSSSSISQLICDWTVKICDYGLLITNEEGHSIIEISVAGAGTSRYMSPQAHTECVASTTDDCWSFGCILYYMLSGEEPYKNCMLIEMAKGDLQQRFKPRPGCPEQLAQLCRDCLEFDPKKRPRNGVELFKRLCYPGEELPETLLSGDSSSLQEQLMMEAQSSSSGSNSTSQNNSSSNKNKTMNININDYTEYTDYSANASANIPRPHFAMGGSS